MRLFYKPIMPLMLLVSLILLSFSTSNLSAQIIVTHEPSFNQINWNTIEVTSSESTKDSQEPSFVVDSQDVLHVVWEDLTDYEGAGTDADIFYKTYDATSQTWSDAVVISTESTHHSLDPTIAIDNKDNLHVVWSDYTDYGASSIDIDIFYKKFDAANQTWGTTIVISTESFLDSYTPFITVDNNNILHVVWSDNTEIGGYGSDRDIFYKKFNSVSLSWDSTVVVSTESISHSYRPALEIDDENNLHVIWDDNSDYDGAGVDNDIFYKKFISTSQSWGSTNVISTESTSDSHNPSITVDSKDNLHVVWDDNTDYDEAGSDKDIFYKLFSSELNVWTSPIVVSSESEDSSLNPEVVVDIYDNLHLVWYDNSNYNEAGTDFDIFYTIRNSESKTWTTTEVVSTTSSNSFYPNLLIDKKYNINIIWDDGTDYNGAGLDTDLFFRSAYIFPKAPVLSRISEVDNQNVELSWDDIAFADKYYVYRSDEPIYNVSSLTSIANTVTSSYTEKVNSSGVYFYAIIASNSNANSQPSNSIHVAFELLITETVTNNLFSNISSITDNDMFIPYLVGGSIVLVSIIFLIRKRGK